MCTTLEKQIGSHANIVAPFHGERLRELQRDGKFLKYVLP